MPTTFLRTTFYFEAYIQSMGPHRTGDGNLGLTLPMGEAKLAGIAVEDIGRTALGIFRRGTEVVGKTVSIAGEHLTGTEIAEAMSKAFGERVTYRPLTHDQFRALDTPGAVEAGQHVPVLRRSRRHLHCRPRPGRRARPEPAAAVLRRLACGPQGRDY